MTEGHTGPLRAEKEYRSLYACAREDGQEGAKMKLYELCKTIYTMKDLTGKNPRVTLRVETPTVAMNYGTTYDGKTLFFGGVSGRLSDIPAYLGGEDVVSYDIDYNETGECAITITI